MDIFKAPQHEVMNALRAVSSIVPRTAVIPILTNLLINKNGPQVEITASDMEVQLIGKANLGGDNGIYSGTVNAKKLLDILKVIPAEQTVTLSVGKDKLLLKSGKSRFSIQSLEPDAYPLMQRPSSTLAFFSVPQSTLRRLIGQVSFAMAEHDTRYFLNGVLFFAEGTLLRVVATDGHRMAVAEATLDKSVAKQEVILPRKVVLELYKNLKEEQAETQDGNPPVVEIGFSVNQARFLFNGLEFSAKLIEGKYVDYTRVIPKNNEHTVVFDREQLLGCMRRVSLMTGDQFKGASFAFSNNAVEISSRNTAEEEAVEDMEIAYCGPEFDTVYNVSYLIDYLDSMTDKSVTLSLINGQSSGLFEVPGVEGYKYVVMPMRR